MEIAERQKFDLLLSSWCMKRIGWNSNEEESEMKNRFATCLHLVSRAQTIFRGHMFNPVPGEVRYYASGLDEQ